MTTHDYGHPPYLQQAAFITSLTWEPDLVWWQTIAKITWHEPSEELAAFMVFTIKAIAESTSSKLSKQFV